MSARRLILGDCLDVLPTLEAGSADAVVTDPPAGIEFMGKEWDSFGAMNGDARIGKGGRTDGRAVPMMQRPTPRYGPSRPARAAFVAFLTAALAECLRVAKPGARLLCWAIPRTSHWTGTAVEDAGWEVEDVVTHLFGTGFPKHKSKLKPAAEFWWLARKPAARATPLNIDAARIPGAVPSVPQPQFNSPTGRVYGMQTGEGRNGEMSSAPAGRWPANVCLSHLPACNGVCAEGCPVRLLDEQAGERCGAHGYAGGRVHGQANAYGEFGATPAAERSAGGPSRFFYCSKASKADRGPGNRHPTVKSTALMRWLCRLVTPPGGTVLDPFMGSGSTAVACAREGFGFVGIERDPDYFATAQRRVADARGPLFAGAPP